MNSKDNYVYDIKESTFVKALAKFDDKLIDNILHTNGQGLDELYDSIRYKEERLYCETVVQLYKYIEELQEEDRKKIYNPEVEYLEKYPNTTIYNGMD